MKRKLYTYLCLLLVFTIVYSSTTVFAAGKKRTRRDLSANEMMEVPRLGENQGVGKLVAVLDSGFTISEPLTRISDMSKAKYQSKEAVETVMREKGITKGLTMLNDKVVFAWNYGDDNDDISDPENHGTHVAGIVAANPAGADQEARGVMPEAQLVLMKVLSGSQPYIQAANDAIDLGVDAINMSFGTDSGDYYSLMQEEGFKQMMERAKAAGVVVAISAGNAGAAFVSGNGVNAEVADYGTLASPSLYPDSMSVASQNNRRIVFRKGHKYIFSEPYNFQDIATAQAEDFLFADHIINQDKLGEGFTSTPHAFVYCGLGKNGFEHSDFSGLDLKGKLALIDRGEITFKEKADNAAAEGAMGVIIINTEGTELPGISAPDTSIPIFLVDFATGQKLKESADKSALMLTDSRERIDNPALEHDVLSSFSSWGLPPGTTVLKPDITAPGGDIFSTLGNEFGNESGTSMASPNLAACSVLIADHARQFKQDPASIRELTQQLMMTYAEPQLEVDGSAYISPRRQGAGLVKLATATQGDVVLNNPVIGRPSFLFSNVSDTLSFELEVINLGDQVRSYDYEVILQRDKIVEGVNLLRSERIESPDLKEPITLAAHETKKLNITVDISDIKAHSTQTNGFYIDGFLIFHSKEDKVPDMHLPFTAFKGDFDASPIFEDSVYNLRAVGKMPMFWQDDTDSTVAKQYSALSARAGYILGDAWTKPGTPYNERAYDSERIFFAPKTNGRFDVAIPQFTLLRNARNIYVTVHNQDGELIKKIELPENARDITLTRNISGEPHGDQTGQGVYRTDDLAWIGKDEEDNYVPEGRYTIRLHGTPTDSDREQTLSFPIRVDNSAPVLLNGNYDPKTNIYTLAEATDNGGAGLRGTWIRYLGDGGLPLILEPIERGGKTTPEYMFADDPSGTSDASSNPSSEGDTAPENSATEKDSDALHFKLPEGVPLSDMVLHIRDAVDNIFMQSLDKANVDSSKYSVFVPSNIVDGEPVNLVYQLTDENGQVIPIEQWSNLPGPGTYTFKVIEHDETYRLVSEAEQKIILTEMNKVGYPKVELEKLDLIKTLIVKVVKPADYPAEVKINLISQTDPSLSYAVHQSADYSAEKPYYVAENVLYGNYVVEIEDVAAGFTTTVSLANNQNFIEIDQLTEFFQERSPRVTVEYQAVTVEPEQPEQPVEPEQPEQPEQPVEPEQPEQPEQPVEPGQPEQPEQPEQPVQPEQPEQPEQPDQSEPSAESDQLIEVKVDWQQAPTDWTDEQRAGITFVFKRLSDEEISTLSFQSDGKTKIPAGHYLLMFAQGLPEGYTLQPQTLDIGEGFVLVPTFSFTSPITEPDESSDNTTVPEVVSEEVLPNDNWPSIDHSVTLPAKQTTTTTSASQTGVITDSFTTVKTGVITEVNTEAQTPVPRTGEATGIGMELLLLIALVGLIYVRRRNRLE